MSKQLTPNRCRHIFTAGRQCGSPSLRHDTFCYYHHTARMPAPVSPHRYGATMVEDFDFPLPEDRDAVQRGIGEVLRRIAAGASTPSRPGSSSTASPSPATTCPEPSPPHPMPPSRNLLPKS